MKDTQEKQQMKIKIGEYESTPAEIRQTSNYCIAGANCLNGCPLNKKDCTLNSILTALANTAEQLEASQQARSADIAELERIATISSEPSTIDRDGLIDELECDARISKRNRKELLETIADKNKEIAELTEHLDEAKLHLSNQLEPSTVVYEYNKDEAIAEQLEQIARLEKQVREYHAEKIAHIKTIEAQQEDIEKQSRELSMADELILEQQKELKELNEHLDEELHSCKTDDLTRKLESALDTIVSLVKRSV